ncbi:MAG TPA: glycosyltransferase family 4 protein [Dermatophilaceae bacterium]
MRIAFATQWFPPEPGTLVAAAIADGLAKRGHEVHVLTGFPNYPTGKLQAGYPLRLYRREIRSDRVTVHRAPLFPSHNASAIKRMANYLSFGVCAAWVARTKIPKPDVWLTYSSPATAALPALTLPRRLRAPSYLLLQDLWPDSVTESGFVPGRLGRGVDAALHRFCDWTYRRSAGIGVISPSMAGILGERGVEQEKIHLLPNWVEDTHLWPKEIPTDALRRSLGLPEGRLFMYAGNIGELQGLESLIEAFAKCPEVSLVLVGEGIARPSLQHLVTSRGMLNVHFVPSQPTERIGRFIAAADVQIVSLRDTRLLRATMPSKLQSCMAASRPVLGYAAGDVADLITASQSGIAVQPGDVTAAVEAIRCLSEMPPDKLLEMGRRARVHYEMNFAPNVGLDRLESWLIGKDARTGQQAN